jgi:alkylhydroperoxidase family enzyme
MSRPGRPAEKGILIAVRIHPVDYEEAPPEARAAYDEVVRELGRITNMKRTLLHSLPAFRALMEWYTLRDTVQPFLGERLTNLFSHAISAENDCLICSTYFRHALIESGEDPDELKLDEREELVIEFARHLAKAFGRVPGELYGRLAARFSDEQIVALTAFGALMVATNVFNNALEVEFDGYLELYRGDSAAPAAPADGEA